MAMEPTEAREIMRARTTSKQKIATRLPDGIEWRSLLRLCFLFSDGLLSFGLRWFGQQHVQLSA
jgi:hypothetical protein